MMILIPFLVICVASLAASLPNVGIIGGTDAVKGEFPYIGAFTSEYWDPRGQFCDATIVSSRWLVTAAHCTEILIGEVWANVGIVDLNDTEVQQRKVVDYIIHPNFRRDIYFGGDIAVVKVDPPFEFSEFVQPVKLPKQEGAPDFLKEVSNAGWGDLDNDSHYGQLLKKVQLPLVEYDECIDLINKDGEDGSKFNNSIICTGPLTGGKGPCNGDSGGPLTQDGVLYGVVNWVTTDGCANNGSVDVYAKVSFYIDWIQDQIDEELTFA